VAASGIRGVALTLETPLNGQKVTQWLNEVLQTQGPDILRAKGILDVAGEDKRLVFQAVHMILEGALQRPWRDDDKRYSRMVFIGRHLDEAALKAWLAERVAKWWVPDRVVFVDSIPRTGVGKFLKRELRDRYHDLLA